MSDVEAAEKALRLFMERTDTPRHEVGGAAARLMAALAHLCERAGADSKKLIQAAARIFEAHKGKKTGGGISIPPGVDA